MILVQSRFATPFVQITCQDTGAFDPPEWDGFNCVLRKIVKFLLNFGVNTCAMSPRLFQRQLRNALIVRPQVSETTIQ